LQDIVNTVIKLRSLRGAGNLLSGCVTTCFSDKIPFHRYNFFYYLCRINYGALQNSWFSKDVNLLMHLQPREDDVLRHVTKSDVNFGVY